MPTPRSERYHIQCLTAPITNLIIFSQTANKCFNIYRFLFLILEIEKYILIPDNIDRIPDC